MTALGVNIKYVNKFKSEYGWYDCRRKQTYKNLDGKFHNKNKQR